MSDQDEIDISATPPDIRDKATNVINDLLPAKSRKQYEKSYEEFMKWRMDKNTSSLSENVLLAYFEELSAKFKATSMWTFYSMLKSTLNIKHNVDIAKYSKLTAFLKRRNEGTTVKKSRTFSPQEVDKFLEEAPDKLYLMTKVGLIFGIMGACRRQELYNVMFNDVQDFDSTIIVTIRNTKTKTNRLLPLQAIIARWLKNTYNFALFNAPNQVFFIKYMGGKCTSQKVGINKLGYLGKAKAEYLSLPNPELYTGHCFRRTSATILVDAGGDITALKRHGGWRSTTVAEGYIDESIQNKVEISNKILNSIQKKEVVNIHLPASSSTNSDQHDTSLRAGQVNINNCTIQTVNNYYYTQ